MKKICVVTTTRAEYGLLKNVIMEIISDSELQLCLIVTGDTFVAWIWYDSKRNRGR